MVGAVIGDIVGSRFEARRNNIKIKDFELFSDRCRFTDDTVMTLAIAKAMIDTDGEISGCSNGVYLHKLAYNAVNCMQDMGRKYPKAGYGKQFKNWITSANPKPYNSYGNGAAMRVSGIFNPNEDNLELLLHKARVVTNITHNHPESIKAVESIIVSIYYANKGEEKGEIKKRLSSVYNLDFSLSDIRERYSFDSSCQGSVPQALEAFFESNSFEDSIRNAISIGGDSDTIAAITGSISEWYYGIPQDLYSEALHYLDKNLAKLVNTCINLGYTKIV